MKRSARLGKIVALSQGFETMAGKGLARARTRLETDRRKLSQLVDYRKEYQGNFHARIQRGPMPCGELMDYRAFLAYLEKVIGQQSARVEQSAREMEAARMAWLSKKQEVNKVAAAAETVKRRENAAEERRELKESDERNLRLHAQGASID